MIKVKKHKVGVNREFANEKKRKKVPTWKKVPKFIPFETLKT